MMKTLINASLLAFAVAGATGCVSVSSAVPSLTNTTGEVWYSENTGISLLAFSSRIYYCPAATGPGPQTCKEAKMIPANAAK